MYLLGTTLLVGGVVMALLAIASYLLVIRGNRALLAYGRAGIYGMFATTLGAWALLVMLFLTRRFDFAYVNNYSSSDLDAFFTVAASWAGQPGSFLIWALCTAICAVLLVERARHFEPYVVSIIGLFVGALLAFTLILNPFTPLTDPETGLVLVPPDGRGLNPLLHNFWMIIHPPVLFVGFALATVPFAFALGGLLRHDYDTWVARALSWTVAAWAVLGLALLLGGYWAYETLGWGGYWGWDPVENSSLVPWLLLTALLHGMLVQRSHGSLRRTNFALAILSFVTVFYSTFLTRSGVLSNFSVHSFVEEGIQGVLLAMLLLLLFGGLGVLFYRMRDIPARPLSESFFSQDNFSVLGILTLVLIALIITLGTSMPIISMIPGVGHWLQGVLGTAFEINDGSMFGGEPLSDGRFTMAVSFYQVTTPPLGIIAVALLIVGPLLGWRDTNMRNLLRMLRWPGLAALVATCSALLLGVRDPLPLAYVGLSVFAGGTNLLMLVRTLRGGWLRSGGYLAHVGLAIMLIGVVGSSAYASPDERLAFQEGETVGFQGYAITFNEWQATEDGGGVLDLTVTRGDERFSAQPELYFDQRAGSTIQNPSIKSYLWQDLYIAPAEYVPANDPSRPLLGMGEARAIGPYTVVFEEFDVNLDAMMTGGAAEIGAKLRILYEGEESTVIPLVSLEGGAEQGQHIFKSTPAALPGGPNQQIELVTFSPEQGWIMVQAAGEGIDDLPVQPARAVITVSTKPAVLLVWVGLVVGIVGGAIATLRRYLEGQAHLQGQSIRLPRGLAGLPGRLRLGRGA